MSNVEAAKISLRLFPMDLDRVDLRVRLRRFVPVDARLDPWAVSLEDRLDASVGPIPDVSGEAQSLRLLRALSAEVDALDATAENRDRARHHASYIGAA